MRFLALLLACVLAITTSVSALRAQDSNTPPSATSTLAALQKVIGEAKSELANAETETKSAAEKLSIASSEARPAAQKEVDAAQAKLNASRQRLAALEQAGAMLHEPGQTGPGTAAVVAIVLVVLLVAGLLFGLGYLWIKSSRASKDESGDDAVARARLAKAVTLGAMTFIVLVSVVTLLFAGINAAVQPDKEKTLLFFDVAKWVLATVLPVVAAWVGGVMAYYFGKENFKAGAENAEKIIKQLTPQQKLESQKASDSGLAIASAAVSRLPAGTNVQSVGLDELRPKFGAFERLPILDDKGCPLACLHLSTLNKYSEGLSGEDKAAAEKMTLGALMNKLGWKPETSFATVSSTDNLGRVQSLMKAVKECSDVFVTADGSKTKPAERWITNDDILKIANA